MIMLQIKLFPATFTFKFVTEIIKTWVWVLIKQSDLESLLQCQIRELYKQHHHIESSNNKCTIYSIYRQKHTAVTHCYPWRWFANKCSPISHWLTLCLLPPFLFFLSHCRTLCRRLTKIKFWLAGPFVLIRCLQMLPWPPLVEVLIEINPHYYPN